MGSIEEIEGAIRKLSASELADFRRWFAEFDGDSWDRQIELDARSGAHGTLIDEALTDEREGRDTGR